MGAAGSIDGAPDQTSFSTTRDGTFTAHVADGRVNILLFTEGSSKSHTLEMFTVDASTGAPGARTPSTPRPDPHPDFGPGEWRGGTVVIRVGDETVQVIDVAGARTQYAMP